MKKIFLTLVALLSMTAVMAQNSDKERKAPKQMTAEEMTTRMTKELSLNDDQKAKVLSLNKEYKNYLGGPGGPRPNGKKMKSGSDNQQGQEPPQMSDSQQKQMKQHMAKRQEYEKKLQKILSSDQYKKYQSQQKRRGPGGARDGKRPEKPQND